MSVNRKFYIVRNRKETILLTKSESTPSDNFEIILIEVSFINSFLQMIDTDILPFSHWQNFTLREENNNSFSYYHAIKELQ